MPLVVVALVCTLVASQWVDARGVARLERNLAAANAELRALETKSIATQNALRSALTKAPASCPAPVQCDTLAEQTMPLRTRPPVAPKLTPEAREDRVRADLELRMARTFIDDELSADEQARAIVLLLEIRRLRSLEISNGLDSRTPPDQRDAFYDAQYELEALTRLSVDELIEKLDGRGGPPEAATEGAVRKRFADEAARVLGVVEPGEVEVLRDGTWVPESP